MEAELGQAADLQYSTVQYSTVQYGTVQAAHQDEHYDGQVVLHQAPLPPNQAEQEYVDISFVNVSVS